MSRTRHKNPRTGEEFPAKTRKKQKDKKFFGYPEDNWARLHGKDGKKRSWGHFAGGSIRPKHLMNAIKNPPPDIDDD